MYMSKNKVKNFLNSIMYLKDQIPKQNRQYFDDATSLYLDRKIEKQSSLMKIVNALKYNNSKDVKQSLLSLNKFKKFEPVKGIKQAGSVYNPDRSLKNFHIMAEIKLKIKYKRADRKNKYVTNIESFND